MKIEDKIYGIEILNEMVLIDLIKSGSLQRLKGISQLGIPDEYYHIKGFSRYEHSLGVLVLLKKLGAGLEEQVAGLLHDVSHTPFSHVIDWVVGDPTKEDYQDKSHKKFIENSEIPKILRKHSLELEFISNYKNFKLLERETPGLCADRLDYSLRELGMQKGWSYAKSIFSNILVKDNQIIFADKEIAKKFGKEYFMLQKEHWGGDEARSRYYLLSKILKKALEKNLISFKDLEKTEQPILKILKRSKDKFIIENLDLLKKGFKVIEDKNGIELKKKFRYVDPEVLINSSYKKLSEISQEYFKLMEDEKGKSNLIKKIAIIPN